MCAAGQAVSLSQNSKAKLSAWHLKVSAACRDESEDVRVQGVRTRGIVRCQPSIVGARWYLLVGRNRGALLCQVVPGEGVYRRDVVCAPVCCHGLAKLEVSRSKLTS